jgi:phosphate transport system substrate-binding protein
MNHRLVVGRARATALKPRRVRFRKLACVAVAVPVLAVPASASALTLTGSGSSAAQPYMLALFQAYSKLHDNKIVFKYIPDGGNAGVKDVQAGRVEFAINTRPPEPSDAGTTYKKLFLDALCIDVNSGNSLSNISLTSLKNVFLGTDTSWSQVSGSNLSATIDPVGRNSSAGQYTFFQQSVLGGATQASNVSQLTSDGLVATSVTKDPDAIGYVGLAHSAEKGEKALDVNGVPCTAPYVKKETYPLFRYDWAVLPSTNPNVAVEQFFSWVATSAAAGTAMSKAGAVPAFNK